MVRRTVGEVISDFDRLLTSKSSHALSHSGGRGPRLLTTHESMTELNSEPLPLQLSDFPVSLLLYPQHCIGTPSLKRIVVIVQRLIHACGSRTGRHSVW